MTWCSCSTTPASACWATWLPSCWCAAQSDR
jgi:hypothetical protein